MNNCWPQVVPSTLPALLLLYCTYLSPSTPPILSALVRFSRHAFAVKPHLPSSGIDTDIDTQDTTRPDLILILPGWPLAFASPRLAAPVCTRSYKGRNHSQPKTGAEPRTLPTTTTTTTTIRTP
ncbi:hypothetical protein V8C26DRAFT_175889 [Trichoderma gracile]